MSTKNGSQRSWSQEFGTPCVVVHVDDGWSRIKDFVVNYGIYWHSYAIFGQDFLGRNIEGNGSQVTYNDLNTNSSSDLCEEI